MELIIVLLLVLHFSSDGSDDGDKPLIDTSCHVIIEQKTTCDVPAGID